MLIRFNLGNFLSFSATEFGLSEEISIGYRKRFQSICERYENDLDRLMNVQKIVNHLDQYYLEYR